MTGWLYVGHERNEILVGLVILRIWYVFATGNLTNKFNIFTVGLMRSYVDTLLCYFCTLSSIPLV